MPTPEDPTPDVLEVGGTRIGYTTEGPEEARPLVMVPGNPGDSRDFRYLAPVLSYAFRIYRLELPAFGVVSDVRWDDYSQAGRAGLVTSFADAMDFDDYVVLGHSMGGPAAIEAAAIDERVDGLVLLASVGLRRHHAIPPPLAARVMRAAMSAPLLGGPICRWFANGMEKAGFRGASEFSPRQVRAVVSHIADFDFDHAAKVADRVTCPTLLAFAEDDELIETAIEEELSRAFDDVEVVRYDEGGHNIQKTQAPDLAARIEARFI